MHPSIPHIGLIVFFTACSSPLTNAAYDVLYIEQLESTSLFEMMVRTLLQFNWVSAEALILVLITVTFSVALSAMSSHGVSNVRHYGIRALIALSCASWFLLLLPDSRRTHLGNVLLADAALMFLIQFYGVAGAYIPMYTLLCGPVGGLALTHSKGIAVTHESQARSLLFMFLLMPALYMNEDQETLDMFRALNPYEMYACAQVFGGATVVVFRFMPLIRRSTWARDTIAVVLFSVAVNANVAASWSLLL